VNDMPAVFGPDTIIIRNNDVPVRPVDRDLVVLNLATNSYVGFDDIGRQIWVMIAGPCRIGDLCRDLAARYRGSPDAIARDVFAFLDELREEELVHVVEA